MKRTTIICQVWDVAANEAAVQLMVALATIQRLYIIM